MIKALRIDHRLVHGQVAFTWTHFLGATRIIVIDDKAAGDDFQKMALNMAKPAGVKLNVFSVAKAVERADKIDFRELLDEKLGYPTPISYEDWVKANHYQEIRSADAKWLYRQELGYIESMKDITLKELAEQRIGEFTDALRKYILD